MDEKSVFHIASINKHEIKWEEVELVEFDPFGSVMALYGSSKRLSIPSPVLWSGNDRERMIEFFVHQIEQREIETKESFWVTFKVWSKNTRIQR